MKELSTRRFLAGLVSGSALALTVSGPPALAGPDPVNQSVADGCQRSPAGLLSYTSPEWVHVNSHNNAGDTVHLIEGSATLSHTADEDLPESHFSYDLDFDVVPDTQYLGLLAGDPRANGGQGNGNFAHDADQGKLHVEWESGSVPAFVWPTEGDRIELWGQWVWDCGHWGQGIETPTSAQDFQGSLQGTGDYFLPGQVEGLPPPGLRGEQTELHPMQALIVTRKASWSSPTPATETDAFISNDGTHAYAEEQCSAGHPNQGPAPTPLPGLPTYGPDFSACVNNPANQRENIAGRSYQFFVPAPPKPAPDAQLTLREQPMTSPAGFTEQITAAANGVNVTVSAPATDDGALHAFGARYYVGWQHPGGGFAGPAPTHLRFTLKSVTVNNSLAEPNPTHPTVAGAPGVGRYNLYLTLNGYWNFIGGRSPEPGDPSWVTGLGSVTDGQTFTLTPPAGVVDFFVPAGSPVALDISGRECDLPRMDPCLATPEVSDSNDHPGHAVVRFPTADAALGDHALDSPNHDPPSSNPNQSSPPPDYRITYSIQRVVDAGGPGTGAASPPGSTGVPSSSPGGNLGGAATVLTGASAAGGTVNGRSGSAGCARAAAPRSRIHRGRLSRHRRIRLRGTVGSGRCASVVRVEVAVARVVKGECRFVDGRGRLGSVAACSRPTAFLRAHGTRRWRVSIRGRFPRGRYLAFARATDSLGRIELRRTHGNVAHFVIR